VLVIIAHVATIKAGVFEILFSRSTIIYWGSNIA